MRSVTSFKKQSSKEKDVNKKLVAKQPVVLKYCFTNGFKNDFHKELK
jgi:hypothetical protein